LYGKLADEIVTPLLMRIIDTVWGDWTYDSSFSGFGPERDAERAGKSIA
jgi:hypothetical protein